MLLKFVWAVADDWQTYIDMIFTPFYCFRAKWVTIKGTKYKQGAILHIGYNENDFPAFWEIQKICIVNRNFADIMFVVLAKETVKFNDHYQCYEVVATKHNNLKIVYSKQFSCYLPLHQVKVNGVQNRTKFIFMRFEIEAP